MTDTPQAGHNSSALQLKSYVERLERIENDALNIRTDRKTVYDELKSAGFCDKTVRKVVRLRKLDKAERQEQDAMLDLYMGHLEG